MGGGHCWRPFRPLVQLNDGSLWRRHIDHLRAGGEHSCDEVPKPSRGQEFQSSETDNSFAALPPSEASLLQILGNHPPTDDSDSSTAEGPTTRRYPTRQRQPPTRLYAHLDVEH